MTKEFVAKIEEDPETGDAVIVIPDALLAKLEWNEGDAIEWTVNDDGTVTIQRATF